MDANNLHMLKLVRNKLKGKKKKEEINLKFKKKNGLYKNRSKIIPRYIYITFQKC